MNWVTGGRETSSAAGEFSTEKSISVQAKVILHNVMIDAATVTDENGSKAVCISAMTGKVGIYGIY